jgi:hypothetical protein
VTTAIVRRIAATRRARARRSAGALPAVLALALAGPAALPLAAQPTSVLLYGGIGTDSNLLDLPGQLLTLDVPFERAGFVGVSIDRRLGRFESIAPRAPGWARDSTWGLEAYLLQHRGRQRNGEIGAAWSLRTPPWSSAPGDWSLGFSIGLSVALGTPAYEDGAEGDPARRHRLQMYNAYEVAFAPAGWPGWELAARVHHRSGAYGLIAPRRVGSNFLAIGLRREL